MQYENKGRYIVRFKDISSPRQHFIENEWTSAEQLPQVELGFDRGKGAKGSQSGA